MLVFLIYFIYVVRFLVFLLLAQFGGENEDSEGWIGGFAFFFRFVHRRENSVVLSYLNSYSVVESLGIEKAM